MCACGRRRGTVGAAVRRHGGNARQEGRRINGKGGEARRTAEHWAAGQTTEQRAAAGWSEDGAVAAGPFSRFSRYILGRVG